MGKWSLKARDVPLTVPGKDYISRVSKTAGGLLENEAPKSLWSSVGCAAHTLHRKFYCVQSALSSTCVATRFIPGMSSCYC